MKVLRDGRRLQLHVVGGLYCKASDVYDGCNVYVPAMPDVYDGCNVYVPAMPAMQLHTPHDVKTARATLQALRLPSALHPFTRHFAPWHIQHTAVCGGVTRRGAARDAHGDKLGAARALLHRLHNQHGR